MRRRRPRHGHDHRTPFLEAAVSLIRFGAKFPDDLTGKVIVDLGVARDCLELAGFGLAIPVVLATVTLKNSANASQLTNKISSFHLDGERFEATDAGNWIDSQVLPKICQLLVQVGLGYALRRIVRKLNKVTKPEIAVLPNHNVNGMLYTGHGAMLAGNPYALL